MSNDEIDALLAEKETSLVADLAELTKPIGEIGTISFGKRIGEGTAMATERITAVSAQEQLMSMLADVRRARERVAEGTYGLCEVCAEAIPEGRLEARPWAVRCIRHS